MEDRMTVTDTAPRLSVLTYLLILLAVVCAAALGAVVSGGSQDTWYAALDKPRGTPPDIAFAIVWPALFALMAIGASLVAHAAGSWSRASGSLGLFFAQLIPNIGWSWLFFGFRMPEVSLIVLVALWIMILAMILAFWRHSKLGAALQFPYLLWVSFAGYLNSGIIWLN
jgi:tryptophan-rich sensory protein